ncbi:Dipeptide-binding ABC transporter, periplasmic substrate-binding component (TC 3.A.1.5.2) [Klebsiella pneumoniae IS39]|nr:Dipeptide-binding ABC transporter, periplasmic substrate-binding component (TC 3.A.1.5.2) [Klebsiella pneumoniae IS39]
MKKTSLLGACILALAMSMGSGEAVAKNAARPADHRHEYE